LPFVRGRAETHFGKKGPHARDRATAVLARFRPHNQFRTPGLLSNVYGLCRVCRVLCKSQSCRLHIVLVSTERESIYCTSGVLLRKREATYKSIHFNQVRARITKRRIMLAQQHGQSVWRHTTDGTVAARL